MTTEIEIATAACAASQRLPEHTLHALWFPAGQAVGLLHPANARYAMTMK